MKGILFKPWKIKAIADSSPDFKWQTRRVIKPQPPPYYDSVELLETGTYNFYQKADPDFHAYLKGKSRYQVGDVVYIKEALYRHPYLDEAGYMLDQTPVFINQTIGDCLKWRWQKDILGGMFMPAWAARYFITITNVRAERLQQISLSDIYAEGCPLEASIIFTDPVTGYENKAMAYEWYHDLWDSINPKHPWASNPFVWVYSFKKVNHKEE